LPQTGKSGQNFGTTPVSAQPVTFIPRQLSAIAHSDAADNNSPQGGKIGVEMARAELLAALVILSALGVSQASADETFDYTGNPFTTVSSSFLSGNNVTASVTLSCNGPCADGTYIFGYIPEPPGLGFPPPGGPPPPPPPISSFTLSTGPNGAFTLDPNMAGVTGSASVTLHRTIAWLEKPGLSAFID
jgi:hypothetical protein